MATLTNAEYAAIAKAYSAYLVEHGTTSIPAEAWKTILPADLYRAAVDGGYFGAPGTITGIDYGDSAFTGVRGDSNPDGGFTYTLWQDGKVIATENGGPNFDTVAFAKRHGVSI